MWGCLGAGRSMGDGGDGGDGGIVRGDQKRKPGIGEVIWLYLHEYLSQ